MSSQEDIVQKVDKTITLYHWTRQILIALLIVLIGLVVVVQFMILGNVQSTTDQLLDCTDPSGQCYQDGSRRQGEAVKNITNEQKRIVTIAAYCAKQPGNNTLEQIEDCVNKELKR